MRAGRVGAAMRSRRGPRRALVCNDYRSGTESDVARRGGCNKEKSKLLSPPVHSARRDGGSRVACRDPMADHDKFVLKEKQKLQEREKRLQKQEAEFNRLKLENESFQADLKAKTAQLAQTADLLRKRDEERDAARREAAAARQALQAARVEAAAAKAAKAEAAAEEKRAKEVAAKLERAESEIEAQRSETKNADDRAAETKAALDATVAKVREMEAALTLKEESLLTLQRMAKEDEAQLAALRAELAAQKRQMEEMEKNGAELRKVLALAFGRHLMLLQSLRNQQTSLASTQADLQQLEALRCADAAKSDELHAQLAQAEATHAAESEEQKVLAATLREELTRLKAADAQKKVTIERLEATRAGLEASLAKTLAELEESQGQLEAAQAQCGGLETALRSQRQDLETAEERSSSLEAQLQERMRWIESLETSQTLHRKRIEELYEQLRVVLALSPGDVMAAASLPAAVGAGVSGAAAAAAGDLEVTLLQAELAGLNERVKLLSTERAQLLEHVVSSESIQSIIDTGSRERQRPVGPSEEGGGVPFTASRQSAAHQGADASPRGPAASEGGELLDLDADDLVTAGPAGEASGAFSAEDGHRGVTEPTSATSGGPEDTRAAEAEAARRTTKLEAKLSDLQKDVKALRRELTAKSEEADTMRARAVTAEGRVGDLERKLRQQVARLRQISQQQKDGEGGSGGARSGDRASSKQGGSGGPMGAVGLGGSGSSAKGNGPGSENAANERVTALQAELAQKQKEVEAKDMELAMLKDMVRARKSDQRTKELKGEVHQRRRIRTDAPNTPGSAIELSPSSSAASTNGTPIRRAAAPTTNVMATLPEG